MHVVQDAVRWQALDVLYTTHVESPSLHRWPGGDGDKRSAQRSTVPVVACRSPGILIELRSASAGRGLHHRPGGWPRMVPVNIAGARQQPSKSPVDQLDRPCRLPASSRAGCAGQEGMRPTGLPRPA